MTICILGHRCVNFSTVMLLGPEINQILESVYTLLIKNYLYYLALITTLLLGSTLDLIYSSINLPTFFLGIW